MVADPGSTSINELEERENLAQHCREQHVLPSVAASTVARMIQNYKQFVRENRNKIELLHEAISKIVFWLPHGDDSIEGSTWREIIYGILSVNELAMYCAEQDNITNSYGTSVSTESSPDIPATALRIILSLIHCMMPALLEIGSSSAKTTERRIRMQSRIRARIEQLKLILRLILLRSYWKGSGSRQHNIGLEYPRGIMMDGGLYQPGAPSGPNTTIMEREYKRRNYIGRRTGLRISPGPQPPSVYQSDLIIGELLYILRPAFWAMAESSDSNSSYSSALTKPFLATLAMDLLSLGLLRRQGDTDPLAFEEWERRRRKLFLYLFRSPFWSNVTSPLLERTSSLLRIIPLLGSVADTYLWDWILYLKHPYVSEEG